LPRKKANRGLLPSFLLHVAAMAAAIWLPGFIPDSPVVLNKQLDKKEVDNAVPLTLPELPKLVSQGSGSLPAASKGPAAPAARVRPPVEPPLEVPDYVKPQTIVSVSPNPVNRVQTILRPDLVSPPQMKFPMRLQSMVSLPAAAPVLETPPPQPPKQPAAPVPAEVDIPKPKPVETAVLTLAQKRATIVPQKAAPAPAVAPNLKAFAKVQGNALKAIVVVNAVDVVPDSAVPLPDAQLAGLFVVGPSPDTNAAAKSLIAGNGRSPDAASSPVENPSRSNGANGATSGADRATGSGSNNLAAVSIGSAPGTGTGSGSGTTAAAKSGAGNGTGTSAAPGTGSGSGAPAHGATGGNTSGISISGGTPGRGNAVVSKAVPANRSYGMMIISGGSNGGASRDLGVFDRRETVYSVTIPMSDAGGGADWTMQYALLNRTLTSTGLLVPPFVQKKAGATMPKAQMGVGNETGPVFITGVIDENGKLQGLRAIRAADTRSPAALRALQQWEFQPAQLDGKPAASKVLIGVNVTGTD
jgi:hypothetical protein